MVQALNNLGSLYNAVGRRDQAEPLMRRALSIAQKSNAGDSPLTATLLNNLAFATRAAGEAEDLYTRALAMREKMFPADHPAISGSLNNLGGHFAALNRHDEARQYYERALAIEDRAGRGDQPAAISMLNSLAFEAFRRRDWMGAVRTWERSTNALRQRIARGGAVARYNAPEAAITERRLSSAQFSVLVAAQYRLAGENAELRGKLVSQSFEVAQWAMTSSAAAALAETAARTAFGDRTLSELARERQDLAREWQRRDEARSLAYAAPAAQRQAEAEAANVGRLGVIEARLAEIDKKLTADFPRYARLVQAGSASDGEVRALLSPDEALVLFLDVNKTVATPEETFIWVVTRTQTRITRTSAGPTTLAREVRALRCGLDEQSWAGAGARQCANLLGLSPERMWKPGEPLPFDPVRAHALYKALFGGVTDLIKGKQLLLVPSGPLTQLPFQVLVTDPPEGKDLRQTAWLTRSHAATVLPAVSSLAASRRVGRPSAASKPVIGFGNPLLDGNPADLQDGAQHARLAAMARGNSHCGQVSATATASLRGIKQDPVPGRPAGVLADIGQIRRQLPLPDTADELCGVARALNGDPDDVRLGQRSTEREVKRLSASGALASYRVVHFATHGLLAGQLEGGREPGLILTPPQTATAEDDGYLASSEIAALKLDADWVILSACNTASGGTLEAEALSGLARAFFLAGGRAVLASHWPVESSSTVKLVTAAVGAPARDAQIGRGEALRRAMLALIDGGAPQDSHPAYWAPFILVGEGGAGR